MSTLEKAIYLAKTYGFKVFPCVPNLKLPAIDDFPSRATTDEEQLRKWWVDPILEIEQPYNIGISTDGLLVVDIDNKGDKRGDDEIVRLESEGFTFPETYEQRTPTGGRHLVYRVDKPVKQGANVLGKGLDIRARGGFVLGDGSQVEAGKYFALPNDLAPAPEWLINRCGRDKGRDSRRTDDTKGIDKDRARERATNYLTKEAPISVEGNGGDETAYLVACKVKDFGVTRDEAAALMDHYWNPRCNPPWSFTDIVKKVQNAFAYGTEPVGAAAPEKQFTPLTPEEKTHPILSLNKEYAFLPKGNAGVVLWDTVDGYGKASVDYLGIQAFHNYHASKVLHMDGGKTAPLTKLWLSSPDRRTYRGVRFIPGKETPAGFYNLWKGFPVKPWDSFSDASKEEKAALDAFIEHTLVNVCGGDEELNRWLMGYFAQMIQRPWEKPLTAIVFQGSRGVGKSAIIDRVGCLLGDSFCVADDQRYLVGNFNAHMENKLFMVFEEAFWSGDHKADAKLKHLITGRNLIIERKGLEAYMADNFVRVAILGNEDWLVPAAHDERRYAVFKFGESRKKDNKFFHDMRVGMERGGYRLLMRYLLDFDLSEVDLNTAPLTEGLSEQKIQSQTPFEQWWFACLTEGRVVGADFGGEWSTNVRITDVCSAYKRYLADRNIRSRVLDSARMGKEIRKVCSNVQTSQRREDGGHVRVFKMPSLTEARDAFSNFIGHKIKWEEQ